MVYPAGVRDFLPDTIPLNTKKGMVSKAVAAGKMTTNNLTTRDCRIPGSSVFEWRKKTGRRDVVFRDCYDEAKSEPTRISF